MKNKGKYILIIILIIILASIIYYFNQDTEQEETTTEYSEAEVIKTDILNTLSSSSYVATVDRL